MKKAICVFLVLVCLFSWAVAEDFSGTTVQFFMRSDGRITGYEAKNHSGYAAAWYDIVCAGISALTQTTLLGLVNVLDLPVDYEIDDSSALLCVELSADATEQQVEQAQVLMLTLYQGLNSIVYSYPGNLKIVITEV